MMATYLNGQLFSKLHQGPQREPPLDRAGNLALVSMEIQQPSLTNLFTGFSSREEPYLSLSEWPKCTCIDLVLYQFMVSG